MPKQVPDVYGVDKSTQILPDDPDLFVFDEEVVVVLEALVGKTLEQGLLEVHLASFFLKILTQGFCLHKTQFDLDEFTQSGLD